MRSRKSIGAVFSGGPGTFAAVPEELRQDVKTLARRDAGAGKISAEAYRQYIGEPYAEEHTEG